MLEWLTSCTTSTLRTHSTLSRTINKLSPHLTPVGNQKPTFYQKNWHCHIIKALKHLDRITIDLVSPQIPSLKSNNNYLFSIIEKFSRFPFAFPIRKFTAKIIFRCPLHLFHIFGNPGFFHSDLGGKPESQEFNVFCSHRKIAKPHTSPYHP